MRRFSLILGCALLSATFAWGNVVFLGGSGSAAPTANILADTPNETVISYNITGFNREKETANGVAYDRISLSGRGCADKIGFPEVPAINETVMIPGDRKVRLDIVDWEEVTLKGYAVWPFQTPATDMDVALPFVVEESFYAGNASYPTVKAEVGTPGIFRDIRVVPLRINPFRYNPASNELTVATKITVKLTYYGQDDVNTLEVSPYRDPDFEKLYEANVINYKRGFGALDAGGNLTNAEYLFICYPDFTDEIAPLAEHYNKLGIYTKVVTTNETGTTNTSIKAYIQTTFSETSPATLKYVLLVGDINYVAAGRRPGYAFVSDYWYNVMDGGLTDPYPDINVGRLSTTDGAKVTHYVNKIIAYFKNPPLTDAWLDKALLVAHKEGAPGKYEGCCEEIRLFNYAKYNPTWVWYYGSQGKTNAEVSAGINAGLNFGLYRGHGSATEWWQWNTSNQSYMNPDFHGLTNGDKTPILITVACDCYDLDYGAECLGESKMNANDACASGNGASDPSYTVPNHDYAKDNCKAVYDKGIYPCGMVTNYANTSLMNIYGPYHMYIDNVWMYLWNGDPALRIWLKKPTLTLSGNHPATFTPGNGRTITVTVTDTTDAPVEGALVGLYKKDDIYCAGLTNASGQVTLTPTPKLGTAGTMYVTASKDMYLTYWGQTTVAATTDVKVTEFNARRVDAGVRVTWNATHEGELRGFNLYRMTVEGDNESSRLNSPSVAESLGWVKVNDDLIVGRAPYAYLDEVNGGNYKYKLEVVTLSVSEFIGPVMVNDNSKPKAFALNQNYPNPAKTETTFSYSLPSTVETAALRVFDLAGREVRTIRLNETGVGDHNLQWNLTDGTGNRLPAGVYVYRLETPNFSAAKRMVVMN